MLAEVNQLLERIGKIHTQMRPKRSFEGKMLTQSLHNLIKQMSSDLGKKVDLNYDDFHVNDIPHQYWLLVREVLVQLIRNAITHGIETTEERKENHKKEQGIIELGTYLDGDSFQLSLKDDGLGIQTEKLRERAIASGKWTPDEVNALEEAAIVDLIFESGISTANGVDMAAGRGVGMDSVRHRVESHKGRISIDSKPGEYTHFHISLPIPKEN